MTVATPEPVNQTSELALYGGTTEATVLAALLERDARAKDALKAWKKEADEVADALREFAGDTTHIKLDGTEVLTYNWKDAFRGADFTKDYPEMAKRFTRVMEKSVLDVDWLKSVHPEVYRRYQTRALVTKYTVRPPVTP